MTRRAGIIAFGLLAWIGANAPALAEEPWTVPTDAAMALRDPDRFAWQLFVALTWPADEGSRAPAVDRPYGDPGPVMFETWALSDQVYLSKGAEPPAWEDIPWSGSRTLSTRALPRELETVRQEEPVAPGTKGHLQEEIRLNRVTFDYIRDNGLYSVEGQQAFYYDKQMIAFPTGAMEVKAVWRPIDEEDKARYQWTTMKATKGKASTYGLTALSISSKVLPNRFWATFEHVDNPYRTGIHDEGWLNPSRDSVACPPGFLDCNRAPAGFGLQGTRWENYRLRGSQVDYVDAKGNPVILGNSELEVGFQQSASCMACHRRSSIGPSRNAPLGFTFGADNKEHAAAPPVAMRLPIFNVQPDGRIESPSGAPEAGLFLLPGQAKGQTASYLPLDFVWSLREAESTSAGSK